MAEKLEKMEPRIRFQGFTDPWEQRKLGEFGSVEMCRRIYRHQTAEKGDVPFYKIGTFGAKPDAFISNSLFEKYRRQYPFPSIGALLISAAGSIGRIVEYQGESAYYQDSNIVWLDHNDKLVDKFLKAFYERTEWTLEGSTIKRLYNKDIINTKIVIPSVQEQEQVGTLFSSIDNLITLHQRKLDTLKKLKKTLLSKLFPKNEEKSPELRFSGFTDDWEQRKLGDLFQQRTEKASGDEDLLSVTIADGVIRQKDSDKRNVSSDDKSNYKIVRKGDLAYNSMRMWQGAVGESDFFGIVSPAYTVLRPLNDLDTKFFMELFKKKTSLDIFRRWSQGLTSDTWNLKFPVLSKITFRVTKSSEQSKIGEFLSSLDHLITLHQRK
uniref:restriction endonuclease subunit S n=1 Tax=Alloscardovia criceti TaxID=356828 RepID=UPI000366B32F